MSRAPSLPQRDLAFGTAKPIAAAALCCLASLIATARPPARIAERTPSTPRLRNCRSKCWSTTIRSPITTSSNASAFSPITTQRQPSPELKKEATDMLIEERLQMQQGAQARRHA